MSTDTTVVLVHGAHKARCTIPILVGLLTLTASLVGQARHGHFYHVNYYQVRPGQEKAYDSALVDVVIEVAMSRLTDKRGGERKEADENGKRAPHKASAVDQHDGRIR